MATRRIWLVGAIIGVLHGCASKAPPRPVHASRPSSLPALAGRLAIMPSDRLLFPELATALDTQLGRARIDGAGPAVKANVSMEVAQLSLECVSATDDCYTQVGRFLQVDRLLWGQIARDPHSPAVTVTVVLLDVGRGAAVARAEATFPKSDAAVTGLSELVDKATGAHSAASTNTVSQTERVP